MRIYFMETPYVNIAKQKLESAELEIFSGEYNSGEEACQVFVDSTYKFQKGKWMQSPYGSSKAIIVTNLMQVHNFLCFDIDAVFSSLELAQAVKILSIQKQCFQRQLNMQDKNRVGKLKIADLDEASRLLKTEYPEYFM